MADQQDWTDAIYRRIQALADEQGISFAQFTKNAGVCESTFYNARREKK